MIKSKLAAWRGRAVLAVLVVGILAIGTAVYAQDYGLKKTAGAIGYATTGPRSEIYGLVGIIVTAFLSLLAFIFFGLMLYSGVRWMTARGNAEFATKAKENLTTSIIGITVILAAYALTRFVISRLGQ